MHDEVSVERLNEHTWVMTEGTGRGARHCYLLEGKEQAAVIDTGLGDMDVVGLAASLTDRRLLAVNTHGHLDHIGRNHDFERVYMHPADEAVFQEHSSYEMRRAYLTGRFRSKGFSQEQIASEEIQDYIERLSRLPRRENRLALRDGQQIDLGGRKLKAIHTPGHTRGSVCILDENYGSVFTGDSLCEQGILLNFTHSAPVEVYLDSMRRLEKEAGGFSVLYPGHQKIALPVDWIRDYRMCAEAIVSGGEEDAEPKGQKEQQKAQETEQVSCLGRAVIRWRSDQLRQSSPC